MGISTHILDTSLGRPAANVPVSLAEFRNGTWHPIGSGFTDADGRCKALLGDHTLIASDYKLTFNVGVYFHALHISALYPYIDIVFTVADPSQQFHIPLLLTANGYTTYRGS